MSLSPLGLFFAAIFLFYELKAPNFADAAMWRWTSVAKSSSTPLIIALSWFPEYDGWLVTKFTNNAPFFSTQDRFYTIR